MANSKLKIDDVKFDERGLVPAVAQDARTLEVLTLAYMNRESLEKTLEEKETWFWSRSRAELWHKGATSGNTQRVIDVRLDCDADAIVVLVEPAGPACHKGERTCFHQKLEGFEKTQAQNNLGQTLEKLCAVISSRKAEMPEGSYTTYLFEKGLDKILKKIGEESSETIIAAKNTELEPLVAESADLIYHLMVLFVERGVTLEMVSEELRKRANKSQKS
jgi:phosphoribosyl-ATP pyrophosphohydrolase/phosphoribosyl-AMP cyclohydrolase